MCSQNMSIKSYGVGELLTLISLILLMLLNGGVGDQKVKSLKNVFCGVPHETVVAVDPTNHDYYPFFVKLHRCSGSGSVSPLVRQCVPRSYQELNIQVYPLSGGYKPTTITVRNHTRCRPECVRSPEDCNFSVEKWKEDECACQCRYPDGPPKELACKENFRWNRHTCRCECARAADHCSLRKIWSNEICGCRCRDSVVAECTRAKMGIDVNCKCVNVLASTHGKGDGNPQYHMFITLLVSQGVLIIILVCALVHWIRKRSRQNSDHSPLDRSDSNKTDGEIEEPYTEVAVESGSTDSFQDTKYSSYSDDVSCKVPLSPTNNETDL